ncbi:hypothetical protein Tco_1146098 [Tanacetum coccineum]
MLILILTDKGGFQSERLAQGEPSLPLFRFLCNVGPAGDWLTFQNRTDRLARHPFKTQTFSEPILYLASLASSWEYALSVYLIFIDGDVFRNFMKRPGQTSTFSGESSSVSKNQDIIRLELAVVRDSPFYQGVGAAEGSRKRHLIIAALEEGAKA